jgi:hypothetical protein
MRVHTDPDSMDRENLKIEVEDDGLDFVRAKEIATREARRRAPDAMLLSWNDRRRGIFYPDHECGSRQRPAWIVFAEARGGNLTVDINDGEYTFIFLKL